MATFTVVSTGVTGRNKFVSGTFTTDEGDTDISLTKATHGLNFIEDNYQISLDAGGLATMNPKITKSGGTLTAVVDDTEGYSGRFYVEGR